MKSPVVKEILAEFNGVVKDVDLMNDTLTAIEGVTVGHASDTLGGTGVTVILFDRP